MLIMIKFLGFYVNEQCFDLISTDCMDEWVQMGDLQMVDNTMSTSTTDLKLYEGCPTFNLIVNVTLVTFFS